MCYSALARGGRCARRRAGARNHGKRKLVGQVFGPPKHAKQMPGCREDWPRALGRQRPLAFARILERPDRPLLYWIMDANQSVTLIRDVEAAIVPLGTKVTLIKGEQAYITQSLGGSYTVVVNGNMFRIDPKDADALGCEVAAKPPTPSNQPRTKEELEREVWNQLKTCYDPEIPVNIVDLGLVYNCELAPSAQSNTFRA